MNKYNKIIPVGNNEIGSEKTFIIAEIGSNHNQSLNLAYESIDAAVEVGANAVKFQSIDINELYYQPSQATIELHKKIDLEESWHYLLKAYCDKKDITFFSSPTYLKAIDILEEIQVSLYKLASAQIGTFPQLVEQVAAKGKPTILSTGIVSYGELERVVNIFRKHNNDQFVILHCNSIYPTPYNRVNLQLMDVYRSMFGNPVGFSDHTDDIYIPIAAVTRGAKVIEKHFALDRNLPVPDAQYSLEPEDFRRMVEGIRAAEQACGSDVRTEIQAEEAGFKQKILTRLVIKRDKKAGEPFIREDFDFKRHTEGIDCRELDFILKKGLRSKGEMKKGTLLTWGSVDSSL
jgi:sialic acid synthase SpsE